MKRLLIVLLTAICLMGCAHEDRTYYAVDGQTDNNNPTQCLSIETYVTDGGMGNTHDIRHYIYCLKEEAK